MGLWLAGADQIKIVGAHQVALALAGQAPFGRACRAQATKTDDLDQRAAWEQLAACVPEQVRRALAAEGVVLFARRSVGGDRENRTSPAATQPVVRGGRAGA